MLTNTISTLQKSTTVTAHNPQNINHSETQTKQKVPNDIVKNEIEHTTPVSLNTIPTLPAKPENSLDYYAKAIGHSLAMYKFENNLKELTASDVRASDGKGLEKTNNFIYEIEKIAMNDNDRKRIFMNKIDKHIWFLLGGGQKLKH